jgi:hypothetical protein
MCRGVTCGLGRLLWVIANMEEMLLTVVSPSLDAYILQHMLCLSDSWMDLGFFLRS